MLVEENPDNNRSPKSDHVKWVVKITGQNIRMIVGRLVVIFMWAYSPCRAGFHSQVWQMALQNASHICHHLRTTPCFLQLGNFSLALCTGIIFLPGTHV